MNKLYFRLSFLGTLVLSNFSTSYASSLNQIDEISSKEKLKVMKPHIFTAHEKAKRGAGKEIVLILGRSGVGKSTIANYMLGTKMKKVKKPGIMEKVAVPANEAEPEVAARMGYNSDATTVFSESFTDLNTNITYCDCPGFMDTRGNALKMIGTLSVELAVRYAGGVKGIMFVLEEKEFRGKSEYLKQVSGILTA